MTQLTHILHVEDDADIANVVRMSLTLLGSYEMQQFCSGTEAVRQAPELNAELLLLDMMMPGLDGLETLACLRAIPQFAKTPAILFSAKTIDMPDATAAHDMGIIGTIRKPFGATELPGQVQALWDAYQTGTTAEAA